MTTLSTANGASHKPLDRHALDHESRVDDDDHRSLKLWLRLLTCSSLVETRVRSRLRAEFDCTLPRFDLVAALSDYVAWRTTNTR